MKVYLICLLVLTLVGCANPFKDSYNDNIGGGIDIHRNSWLILSSEDPKLLPGNDIKEDHQKMLEDGYLLLGSSSFFYDSEVDKKQALSYGKELHASVILFYSQYAHTESGVTPFDVSDTKTTYTYDSLGTTTTSITYGTRTTYIPYRVNYYNYVATYWIKEKPLILGVIGSELTSELKKQINSNKGLLVKAVVKGSPAFSADLLKGDIIKKINDAEIINAKVFYGVLREHAGENVDVLLIRNEKEITKTIQLSKINK